MRWKIFWKKINIAKKDGVLLAQDGGVLLASATAPAPVAVAQLINSAENHTMTTATAISMGTPVLSKVYPMATIVERPAAAAAAAAPAPAKAPSDAIFWRRQGEMRVVLIKSL